MDKKNKSPTQVHNGVGLGIGGIFHQDFLSIPMLLNSSGLMFSTR